MLDDLHILFNLRQGVTFHNGENFNAKAVKFSLERFLDPEANYANAGQFSAIKGLEIVDDYQVILELNELDASILDKLTAQLYIVPPLYYTAKGAEDFAKAPIGTGPFRFISHERDVATKLAAFESYWEGSSKGKPLVDEVIFKVIPEAASRVSALQLGTVDIISQVPADMTPLIERSGNRLVYQDTASLLMVWFASDIYPFLQDTRVRQALNYAVNSDAILASLAGGYGTRLASPLTPLSLGFDESLVPYPYDPEKAKALLAEADFDMSQALEFSYTSNIDKTIAEAIAADLNKLGLKVTLKAMDLNAFNDAWFRFSEPNPTALFIASWGGLFDPASEAFFLHSGYGASYYNNPEVDSQLQAAQATLNLDERAAHYQEVTKLTHEDPAGIYLWSPASLYGVSARVLDWQPHPRDIIIVSNTALK
ncbi:MAG: ABC transporter substrate-binding protein [Deinococcales bacterium]